MREIKEKFDKKDIADLPVEAFGGRIYVLLTEREAEQAVKVLMRQPIVGIDTETRPTFRRGQMRNVALLQVSTWDTCFLFRLNRMGIPPCVVQLFESPKVAKVGLSLKDDFAQLRRSASLTPQACIDLQDEVKRIGIQDLSLQKIYANLFGRKISKRQQLTNWEADVLTSAQQLYAATDAWACLRMHEEIGRLWRQDDYVLIKAE